MGTISFFKKKKSLSKYFPNFHLEDWIETPFNEEQEKQKFGEYITFRNKVTKEQIDRYDLCFNSEKQESIYQDCFMQRLRQQYLVNAFHYEPFQNHGICSDARGATVYIQHIPIRLSDITDIPIDQSIYILKCSLSGFEKLFKQIGYFKVIEELIGIDKEGHVRVWLNSDLSKNYPYGLDEDPSFNKDTDRKMVGQIISLIQQNTSYTFKSQQDNGQQSINVLPFSCFLQNLNIKNPNFRQSLSRIDQYAIQNQIKIPKHCSSIIQIFNQDYGEDFNLLSDDSASQHANQQLFSNTLGQSIEKQSNRSHHSKKKSISNKQSRMSKKSKSSTSNPNKNNSVLLHNQQNSVNRTPNKVRSSSQDQPKNEQQQPNQIFQQFQPTSIYKPLERNNKIFGEQRDSSSYIPARYSEIKTKQNGQIHSLHSSNVSQSISQNSNLRGSINSNRINQPTQHNTSHKKKSSLSSDSIQIQSNSSIPKITFNYVNPTPTKTYGNSNKYLNFPSENGQSMKRISQNSNQHSPEHELDLKFEQNIYKDADKDSSSYKFDSNRSDKLSQKNGEQQDSNSISENSPEDEQLDPQIMKDLIKLYPHLLNIVAN